MSESTNKKIHKLQIYKETYDIDVKKDLNESDPSSVAYVHNRTHYLNNPLVITLPYKDDWSYSLKPDLALRSLKPDLSLKPDVDYVIQFELVNNTGALVSRIFQYDGSLNFSYSFTFSYLDTKTNKTEDLKLVIKPYGITLDISEASDQIKTQLKAEPLKINIIKASDITKLPNSYLNIAFDPNEEDKNNASLATKTSIDALKEADETNLEKINALELRHEADFKALKEADEETIEKINALESAHISDVAALKEADETIKSTHEADIKTLQEADAEIKSKHSTDVADLKAADAENLEKINALESKHDTDVKTLQDADEANLKEAKQYTYDKIKAESDQRQEVDNKLIEAVHSIANVEQIDDTDSGILCINPYNVIPKT